MLSRESHQKVCSPRTFGRIISCHGIVDGQIAICLNAQSWHNEHSPQLLLTCLTLKSPCGKQALYYSNHNVNTPCRVSIQLVQLNPSLRRRNPELV